MRLAFVTTWYGKDIGGGAEAECYGLVHQLKKDYPEIDIEIVTTTLNEFSADWNTPVHTAGQHREDGLVVHRFDPTRPDRGRFHFINGIFLMPQYVDDLWIKSRRNSPLNKNEEKIYRTNMIESPGMADFLRSNRLAFDFFIFIPYMFGPTIWGSLLVNPRAIVIPCLHNERYIYLDLFQKVMREAAATIYHVPSEQRLANRVFAIKDRPQLLLGEMVDIGPPQGSGEAFRKKYKIEDPYILYAGRKIVGKNLPMLIEFFKDIKLRKLVDPDLKLVIMGGGDLQYGDGFHKDIFDLGFLPKKDKYDAYAGALCLVQPSVNESFSIVMMESWLQQTPVLVYDKCEVTKEHIETSKGGGYYGSPDSLASGISTLLRDKDFRTALGQAGCQYVTKNFAPELITEKLVKFLDHLKIPLLAKVKSDFLHMATGLVNR